VRLEAETNEVCDVYAKFRPGFKLTESERVSVKHFIDELGLDVVVDAMERSCADTRRQATEWFRYFCGICWNKVRDVDHG
jgi:hypothetical protein